MHEEKSFLTETLREKEDHVCNAKGAFNVHATHEAVHDKLPYQSLRREMDMEIYHHFASCVAPNAL